MNENPDTGTYCWHDGSGLVDEDCSSPCHENGTCDTNWECTGGTNVGCDDGDACTTDYCDVIRGCTAEPPCEDGNPCTEDICDNQICSNTPSTGGACDDGDVCTDDDTCSAGICVGGTPISCDDGNWCTDDTCDSVAGCQHTPNFHACDDGDECTLGDICDSGACVSGQARDCDDGDLCTVDGCDPASGCAATPSICDDGNPCTNDGCDPATGCTNLAVVCEDGDPCTSDACDPASGECVATPLSCDPLRVHRVKSLPPIYVEDRFIPQGAVVSISMDNLSPGADPVMHLLYLGDSPDGRQVAWSDDCGGSLAPCLDYQNNETGTAFRLVVRAKSAVTTGTGDLLEGIHAYRPGIPVGGLIVSGQLVPRGAGETMQTAHVPGGSLAEALFAFADAERTTISRSGLLNGPALTAWIVADGFDYLVGTAYYYQTFPKTWYFEYRTGDVALYVNDVESVDSDEDGLGDGLEAELLTCPSPPCGLGVHDSRDSDRDGLLDGVETLGLAGLEVDGRDDVDFPRWGSNPRHKDVFIEVDHLDNQNGMPVGNPFAAMGDPAAWVESVRAPYAAGPAHHLKNPDGLPGVDVHLDLGIDPVDLADEPMYGDYGGMSRRAVALDWRFEVLGPVEGNITVSVDGVPVTFDAT